MSRHLMNGTQAAATHSTSSLNYDNINLNGTLFPWATTEDNEEEEMHEDSEFVFDRPGVRITLICAYTLVFTCCFLGNLLVIVVVVVHRRMRTVTNFFLTNLAFADLCVGIFCVYQNLSIYLTRSWAFGDVLCKMYHFVHSLSYTASVAILTVICLERYVAIVHPIWSKQVLTIKRLRAVIVLVWITAAAYCSPRLIVYGTTQVPSENGGMEPICAMKRSLYNSHMYDLINFFICFLLPLSVMSVMYFIIGIRLWCSSYPDSSRMVSCGLNYRLRPLRATEIPESTTPKSLLCCRDTSQPHQNYDTAKSRSPTVNETSESCSESREASTSSVTPRNGRSQGAHTNHGKDNCHVIVATTVLLARRRAIRLLVTVVLSFALCNLPFHARKLWQYWSAGYKGSSTEAVFLTIATTLVLYLNSGINPIIYAFLSDNFRKSMADVIKCRIHQKITRQASMKSTYNRTLQSSVGQHDLIFNKQ